MRIPDEAELLAALREIANVDCARLLFESMFIECSDGPLGRETVVFVIARAFSPFDDRISTPWLMRVSAQTILATPCGFYGAGYIRRHLAA